MIVRRRWLVLGILLGSAAAGCGDDGGDTDAAGSAASATDAGTTTDPSAGADTTTAASATAGSTGNEGSTSPGADGSTSDTGRQASPTRIFVTLVSHNEDTNTGENADCLAFFDNLDTRFDENRSAILEIAELVVARGAAWDFQTDVQYLQTLQARESVADNVVRTLAEIAPDRIVVDAHAHEGLGKNYADVANLTELMSGSRNGVIGGFTAVGCTPMGPQPDWEKFWAPLAPQSPMGGDALVATVLTDGASAGHQCDPSVSGVWRPASHEMFFVDDPTSTLPTIGVGLANAGGLDGEVDALAQLLADLDAGRLEPGRMYTSSVTIPQCNFDLPGSGVTPDDIAAFIDEVDALGGDDIVWATFPGIVEIWQTDYDSQPSVWPPG